MTPAAINVLSRAAMRSRGAPVPRTMSLNRVEPNAISRTTSNDHRSPTTSSAAAIGHGRPGRSTSAMVDMGVSVPGVSLKIKPKGTRSLAAIAAGTALVLITYVTPMAPLPGTAADLGADAAARAWLLSAMPVGLAAGLLAAGVLGDNVGRRRVYV